MLANNRENACNKGAASEKKQEVPSHPPAGAGFSFGHLTTDIISMFASSKV